IRMSRNSPSIVRPSRSARSRRCSTPTPSVAVSIPLIRASVRSRCTSSRRAGGSSSAATTFSMPPSWRVRPGDRWLQGYQHAHRGTDTRLAVHHEPVPLNEGTPQPPVQAGQADVGIVGVLAGQQLPYPVGVHAHAVVRDADAYLGADRRGDDADPAGTRLAFHTV